MSNRNYADLPCGFYLLALVLTMTFMTILGYFEASMEAAAFERVTGKKVSAWDAMFIELRVDESPKNDDTHTE